MAASASSASAPGAGGSREADMVASASGAEAALRPLVPADWRELLYDFYRIHDPDKLPDVDAVADKYADRRADLQAFLAAKYGSAYFAAPALDFRSRFFDPGRALYDDAVLPPVLDAMPADNLYKAQLLLPPGALDQDAAQLIGVGKLHGREDDARDRAVQEGALGFRLTTLDFLADQHVAGPLAPLRAWFIERARVRVVTRRPTGLRALLRGGLTGFDGAGNVLLSDATEDYLVDSSEWELTPPPRGGGGGCGAGSGGGGGGLPDGWLEKRSPALGGRPFYFNKYTCTSQWERPVSPLDRPVYRRVNKFSVASRTHRHVLIPATLIVSVARAGSGVLEKRRAEALMQALAASAAAHAAF